uniref:Myosin IXb n=1 Tax=Poecilia mexicana TaxID=48701 RepID=A0A3B3XL47_9TELE
MSTTDGAGTPEHDEDARVVQIYPRLPLETETYCPLQVSIKDTAKTVIHNVVVTLGLDSSQSYSLLEVKQSGSKETPLDDGDRPLERVLCWPPETQKWHPPSQGYYFVLQQSNNGAKQVATSKEESDDLCSLPSVTQEAVLQVLRQRFHKHKIYTYISNILVAVNPNKFLPLYYNPKYVKLYENQPLGKLSPHIFAIADVAFRTMLSRQANQCILISGESGSGKTESSSYLIHCLTTLNQGKFSGGLERAILGAGPVLEAFGNAQTAENNNCSRFGKFIQLIYLESGVIRGAFIEKFLLEKNRLVSRAKNERNFHVFYCLLMGSSKDEQEEFHLLKPQDYVYLNQEDDPKQEYKRLQQAMEMVGFLTATKKRILSVVSAILLLGNVTFSQSKDTEVLEAGPAEVLSSLSHLLMVKKEQLVTTLTKKKVVTAASSVVSYYTRQEAVSARDSMAKSLYSALFDWIILHINHAMLNRRDLEESVSCLSIGVLDMFGFENLQRNSFEQLCINYANEKQQFYINQNIFKLEQEVYVSEGITWENINFIDNSDCIQLISDTSAGLLHLLNKESKFPQAPDETLLEKFKQHHQSNPRFGFSPFKQDTFTIEHYAGKVKYHIKDFKKKNTEFMRPEVVSLLRSSKRSFLHHLVASNPEALFRWSILRATIRIVSVLKKLLKQRTERSKDNYFSLVSSHTSNTLDFSFDRSDEQSLNMFEDIFVNYEEKNSSCVYPHYLILSFVNQNLMNLSSLHHIVGLMKHDRTSKSVFHPIRRADPPTVGAQFQTSLGKLIETIEKAEPFFIFCLRSNAEKKQLHFDDEVVLNQIKYTGILQMIHMQKSSYKAKYTFKEFVEKFRILLPKGTTGSPQEITELFEKMGLEKSTYQIGKTKVFLKEKERQLLQSTLNKEVMQRIVTLQRWFRACLIRLHFLQKKDATMIIQRSWREFFEKQNRAATVIQMAWRISQSLDLEDHENRSSSLPGASSSGCESSSSPQMVSLAFIIFHNLEHESIVKLRMFSPFSSVLFVTCLMVCWFVLDLSVFRTLSLVLLLNGGYKRVASSQFEPCPFLWPCQGRVRLRKPKKHKRRLAYARSGLVYSFGGSKENEYWSFPLPPISPTVPTLTGSASVMDVCGCFPELWKCRSPFPVLISELFHRPSMVHMSCLSSAVTLPRFSPQSYHMTGSNESRVQRKFPYISRATRALQADASLDREITDPNELRHLDEFLGNQGNHQNHVLLTICYKSLMNDYRNKVSALSGRGKKSEVSLVVNLFQSVLDGFIRAENKRGERPGRERKGKKMRNIDNPLDHLFSTYQVNIMQSCDLCNSFIWVMEKACMCSACKFICHKKCLDKIITDCSTRVPGSLHFGVQVCVLTSKANPVPKVVELLLMHVELNGLYTEGIYRKSGAACRAKELHQILQIDPENVCLDNYPIHTITGLVKRWLRELPEPLMTFPLYNDFLHAAELPENQERIRAVYQKVDELPPANYHTLERLIFHLVKVAKEEKHNKMSPTSLAIVFAPCILRSADISDPLLCMKDVPKSTLCLEILINEQLKRYNEKMQDIQELEYAEAQAVHKLKLRRQNTVRPQRHNQKGL